MKKIKELFSKYYDVIAYLVFGVLTTVVYYLVYMPLHYWLGISATVSTVIAWVISVTFAFLTNKPFVFRSHDWSKKTLLPEIRNFVVCRVGSGLLDMGLTFVTVDLLKWENIFVKLGISVLVVILNYVGSKLLVFKNQ